jgi:hypothetical protein
MDVHRRTTDPIINKGCLRKSCVGIHYVLKGSGKDTRVNCHGPALYDLHPSGDKT